MAISKIDILCCGLIGVSAALFNVPLWLLFLASVVFAIVTYRRDKSS